MTDQWILGPPLTDSPLPPAQAGASIRTDFSIQITVSQQERLTCFDWRGLSRQEVANLRSLLKAEALLTLLSAHGYGLSQGATLDVSTEIDPTDAEFSLIIDSTESIPQATMDELVTLINHHWIL